MDVSAGTYLAQERDLDLMLLEELQSGEGFDDWLAERIDLRGYSCRSAEHSVSARANARWGETDVLAFFSNGSENVAVLVEDKLTARFTDRQAARYHERAAEIVREGRASRYMTVLVAPAAFLAKVPAEDGWAERVAIEDIRDWFAARPAFHHRWRAAVLDRCLAHLLPRPAPGREGVIRFSSALSRYLMQHYAPALSHNPGKDASGPIIRFPGCSSAKTLWWKVSTNQMSLQLMGPLVGLLRDMTLPSGVSCEATIDFRRQCAYLVIPIAAVDLDGELDMQLDVVEEAVAAAYRLLALLPSIENRQRK